MNRSPCLTSGPKGGMCPYAGEDKDDSVCGNCQARVEYATKNSCPCSYPDHQSCGHGGFNIEDLNKNHIPQEERTGPYEDYIKQKCIEAGITVEDVRGSGRKRHITAVRREIIQELDLQGVGYKEICKILDKTEFAVWYHLNRTPPTEDRRYKKLPT